jgi:hypothetical protein
MSGYSLQDWIKMKKACIHNRKNSGQVLVITSLVVVMLFLSTVVYVTEIGKDAPVYRQDATENFGAVKQAALRTVISALVNITNGGTPSVLADDLARLKNAVESNSYDAIADLEFAVQNSAPYANGTYVSWGVEGVGISSSFVNVALNSTGVSSSYYSDNSVNVTSLIRIDGYYTQVNESVKQVSLSVTVRNEDNPASADNFAFYFQPNATSSWIQASSPRTIDYGNGTYQTSFTAENATLIGLPVSVHCQDIRGISIWANMTCSLR